MWAVVFAAVLAGALDVAAVLGRYHPDRRIAKDAKRAARAAKSRSTARADRVPAPAGAR